MYLDGAARFAFLVTTLITLKTAQSALFDGRLRGPNVCYHYDIGRYCCPGFTQIRGFCILNKNPGGTNSARSRANHAYRGVKDTTTPKVKFARRPYEEPEVINLSKVDAFGRLLGVAYSHGRAEARNKQSTERQYGSDSEDYNVPYDMTAVRQKINSDRRGSGYVPSRSISKVKPVLRFQPSPVTKAYRPWDVKGDRVTADYSQVAVGKIGDGYVHVVLSGDPEEGKSTTQLPEQSQEGERAEFKQRALVTRPLANHWSGRTTKAPTSSIAVADDAENRIYFKSGPVDEHEKTNPPRQQSQHGSSSTSEFQHHSATTLTPAQPNIVRFAKCPNGYTSVYSPMEGDLCYPTSALLDSEPQIQRTPLRGDAAVVCPQGHQLKSSKFGDACVPFDWKPCSGDPGCSHGDDVPIVNPISIAQKCQSVASGVGMPCRSTDPQPVRCNGISCGDPNGCGPSGCGDCTEGGCGDPPGVGDCFEGSCDDSSVAAAGGSCLNGGTKLDNGICICKEGFEGSRCEFQVASSEIATVEEDDVDECNAEGTDGRGPCSHQCLNMIGSYKCFCPAGSILAPDGVSCMLITCPKCMHGGYCDTDSNKCVCPAGFTGEICEKDIDECAVGGTCSHECRNTFGSYACLCKQGHTLLRDGYSCEDWRCRPSCVNGGVCIKNRCSCRPGFSGIICQFNNRL